MKALFTLLLVVLSIVPGKAQETETRIETKSVEIEDLISFVVKT